MMFRNSPRSRENSRSLLNHNNTSHLPLCHHSFHHLSHRQRQPYFRSSTIVSCLRLLLPLLMLSLTIIIEHENFAFVEGAHKRHSGRSRETAKTTPTSATMRPVWSWSSYASSSSSTSLQSSPTYWQMLFNTKIANIIAESTTPATTTTVDRLKNDKFLSKNENLPIQSPISYDNAWKIDANTLQWTFPKSSSFATSSFFPSSSASSSSSFSSAKPTNIGRSTNSVIELIADNASTPPSTIVSSLYERNEKRNKDEDDVQNFANDSDQFTVANETDFENFTLPSYPDFTQLSPVWLTFVLLYIFVMLTAVLGNLLVCYTVLSNRKMQTVVNCYIVNLAICDLLIGTFVLPSKMLELLAPSKWRLLTNPICTVMGFLQTVFVFASVLTLVATCFERYFAIVHPLKSRMQQSKARTCRILIAVWLLSFAGSVPNFYGTTSAIAYKIRSDFGVIRRRTCIPEFEARFRFVYYTFLFVAFYLIPLLLIAFTCFCIARSLLRTSVLRRQGSLIRQEVNRRKVGKMILIVVLSFTIAWTPYFLVTIFTQYVFNFMINQNYYFTMLCINLFAFSHSSINPVIYATMSTRFRQGFMRIIRLLLFCEHRPSTSIAGQTSFNEQVTSSRGSIVNNGTIKRSSQS